MRISHGRFILTNKDQIEKALNDQAAKIALLRVQLDLAREWANEQLDIHQPYTHKSDLDMSCHEPAKLAQAVAAKIAKNIWCARCRNPWPCKHIANLRLLRDVVSRHDLDSLKDVAEKLKQMERPARSEGQIDVIL